MTGIGEAIASVKATYDLLSLAIDARDDSKISSALAGMQKELLDALAIATTQFQTVHALELEAQKLRTQLLEMETQKKDVERELENRRAYKLAEPAPGCWAYVREEATANTPKGTAYFCPACYAEKREVPMQYREASPGMPNRLVCPADKEHTLNLGGALPAARTRFTTITP